MIVLKNKDTGLTKECPTGFSWTCLFFGVFVPLIRGDLKWAFIAFLLSLFSFGLAWLVFPFIYNKIYIKGLMSRGFIPADDASYNWCIVKGLLHGDLIASKRLDEKNEALTNNNEDVKLLENNNKAE